ncbi:hypothetical protein ASE00_04805 [Sphingomonas sp. Root710]|uniref:hypothetical protein n=1 Tax=Sphingomonas sp. Root710 TaxID=1736594 RepID=UPI0006FF40B0|nr:hypothetical protein [Sphingomonas sp. Root710]KRB86064.1 hypothetical protein ASE00_04805 [Sphingomonas sp. Root710]
MAEDTSEGAMRRRWIRWLTLAEILGVAALLISALTLWNNYSERRAIEASRSAEDRKADSRARTLVLKAVREKDGDRLTLSAAAADQIIQGQTIAFPKALGVDPVDSTDPRIEARWFADGLKQARHDAGENERVRGDARLPVAITTRFTVNGELAEDVTLYDIGYTTQSGGLLGGVDIKLRGLSLIGRSTAKAAPARIDALWKARHKGKA